MITKRLLTLKKVKYGDLLIKSKISNTEFIKKQVKQATYSTAGNPTVNTENTNLKAGKEL